MAGNTSFLTDTAVMNLIQGGFLERMFHDALKTQTKFRLDTNPSKWQNAWGKNKQQTRRALLQPYLAPLYENGPAAETGLTTEYWMATIQEYGRKMPASVRKSSLAIKNLLLEKAVALGEQGGLSIDHLARLRYYEMAYWGHAKVTAAVSAATSVPVSSLLGFNKVHNGETLVDVSASNPLPVTIVDANGDVKVNVTAATPTDASKPDGPGTLTVDVAVTVSANDPIYTDQASYIAFPSGKSSLGGITASDVFSLAQARAAKAYMQMLGVPKFPDGTYHCYLDSHSADQLFADSEFQSLYRGQANAPAVIQGQLARLFGITFIENEHVPSYLTIPSTYGDRGDFLPVPVDAGGPPLYYPVMIGNGSLIENWVDIVNDVNAGAPVLATLPGTKTVTARQVGIGGVAINVDRLAMHFTPPTDAFGDTINASWEFFGEFAQPTDYNTVGGWVTGQAVYKRVVMMPHA